MLMEILQSRRKRSARDEELDTIAWEVRRTVWYLHAASSQLDVSRTIKKAELCKLTAVTGCDELL